MAVITAIAAENFSIGLFTRLCMDLSRKGLRFITRTKTRPTTSPPISKASRAQNTSSGIGRGDGEPSRERSGNASHERSGQKKSRTQSSAITAVLRSPQPERGLDFAPIIVSRLTGAEIQPSTRRPDASAAVSYSWFLGTKGKPSAQPPAHTIRSAKNRNRAWFAENNLGLAAPPPRAVPGFADTHSARSALSIGRPPKRHNSLCPTIQN